MDDNQYTCIAPEPKCLLVVTIEAKSRALSTKSECGRRQALPHDCCNHELDSIEATRSAQYHYPSVLEATGSPGVLDDRASQGRPVAAKRHRFPHDCRARLDRCSQITPQRDFAKWCGRPRPHDAPPTTHWHSCIHCHSTDV